MYHCIIGFFHLERKKFINLDTMSKWRLQPELRNILMTKTHPPGHKSRDFEKNISKWVVRKTAHSLSLVLLARVMARIRRGGERRTRRGTSLSLHRMAAQNNCRSKSTKWSRLTFLVKIEPRRLLPRVDGARPLHGCCFFCIRRAGKGKRKFKMWPKSFPEGSSNFVFAFPPPG